MGRVRESEKYTLGKPKAGRRNGRESFTCARPDCGGRLHGRATNRVPEESKRPAMEKSALGRTPSQGRGGEAPGGKCGMKASHSSHSFYWTHSSESRRGERIRAGGLNGDSRAFKRMLAAVQPRGEPIGPILSICFDRFDLPNPPAHSPPSSSIRHHHLTSFDQRRPHPNPHLFAPFAPFRGHSSLRSFTLIALIHSDQPKIYPPK
jgi:hypothetical protein